MGTGNVAVVRLVQSVNNQAEKCATKLLKSAKWYGMQLICKAHRRTHSIFILSNATPDNPLNKTM